MDPASFAIGIVGLAGLLEACISGFNRVETARHYGKTSGRLQMRFENQKFHFEKWAAEQQTRGNDEQQARGNDVDCDRGRAQRVEETLHWIKDSLLSIEESFNKQGKATLSAPGNTAPRSAGVKTEKHSVRSKFKWSMGGKESLTEQVEGFEEAIRQLHELVPSVAIDAVVESFKNWLNATSSKSIYEQILSCRTDETCRWIFGRPEYTDWLKAESTRSTLWLHAPPGLGKSVLSAAIAEQLGMDRPAAVLSYFCSSAEEQLRLPSNILRSCLTQFLMLRPELCRIADSIRVKSDSQVATDTEMFSLLESVLSKGINLILILDGFDECHVFENEVQKRCDFSRASFLSRLRGAFAGNRSRLLIVSRDESDIRSALSCSEGHDGKDGKIEYGIRPQDVQADIDRMSTRQMELKLPARSIEIRNDLSRRLVEKSEGMFLWVRLQTKQLNSTMNVRRMQQTIERMPQDLNRAYEESWARIQSSDLRDRAMLVLRWATFAVRPLTALEMFEATAIHGDGTTFVLSDEWLPDQSVTIDLIRRELLEPCQPFLVIQNEGHDGATVQIAHFSMKTFLTGRLMETRCCKMSETHEKTLAMSCLGYLSFGLPWTDLDVPDTDLRKHPLLDYARDHWMRHLDCEHISFREAQILTRQFFDTSNTHWIKWRDAFETRLEENHPAYIFEGDLPYRPDRAGDRGYYASLFGLTDALQDLLDHDTAEANLIGGRHGTALQAACIDGHLLAAQKLLRAGADVNLRSGLRGSALNAAAATGREELASLLLTHGADFTIRDDWGRNALYTAASYGNETIVRKLIELGAPLEKSNSVGWTPLDVACLGGHTSIATLLVDAGANPNVTDDDEWTPLHSAAAKGLSAAVQALLRAGADPNATNELGWTPLNWAANEGHSGVVDVLLGSGADASIKSNIGDAPIHLAAINGHNEVVKLLLESGADASVQDYSGHTPMRLAADKEHDAIMEVLLKFGASPHIADTNGTTPLSSAAANGHAATVEILLKFGASPHIADANGRTPSYFAADNGHATTVEMLLKFGASPHTADSDGWTPIDLAAENGHATTVEVLLKFGASPHIADANGWTALSSAAANGHTATAQVLLDAGASPLCRSKVGWTPVYVAAANGHLATTELLTRAGADKNGRTDEGFTALFSAAHNGHLPMVRFLRGQGARESRCGPDDWEPLQAACSQGHTDVVRYYLADTPDRLPYEGEMWPLIHLAAYTDSCDLIDLLLSRGAEIDVVSCLPAMTPLQRAVSQGRSETVNHLISRGANIHAQTKDDKTALHFAAEFARSGIAAALLRAGSSELRQDGEGWTPLNVACSKGHVETVEALLLARADVQVKNRDGLTPLQIAVDKGFASIVQLLLSHGAATQVTWHEETRSSLLHMAVDRGLVSIVQLLLFFGANPQVKNDIGQTAVDYAIERGDNEIIQLMKALVHRRRNWQGASTQSCDHATKYLRRNTMRSSWPRAHLESEFARTQDGPRARRHSALGPF